MPRKEAIDLVRNRRGIDLLTRSVLRYMLGATRDSLMLFWISEIEVAKELEVGHRSVQRVFARLRLAGLIMPTVWPIHLAGPRRTQAVSYSVQVSVEGLDRLLTPAAYRATERSKRLGTTSNGRAEHHVQKADSPRPMDIGHHVPRANEFERHSRLKETGGGGDRESPTPPVVMEGSPKQAEPARKAADLKGKLRVLCAKLGYSTRSDALEELEAWLKGQGMRSWSLVEDFLQDSARAILPINQEAQTKGLYLRHVRPHYEAWRYVEEIQEGEAVTVPPELTPAMSSTCFPA